ncbi:DGQHR domain-containing protein [Wenzhouxiangella sp. XN24]|nr:DGQHR domain-containing protein [Wenzhouxiangella sp. XN24]
MIHQFASVHFAQRVEDGELAGYQRERVSRHIAAIHAYLQQEGALLPNAIVIAFNKTVAFTPLSNQLRSEWGTFGTLSIPLSGPRETKPGFIVDGQQRVAALSELEPSRPFPVVVVGFCSDAPSVQREQFVLVNRTKPLPKDLLNELLPHIDAHLPDNLRLRRVAAAILEVLRFDKNSPFCGRIRGLGSIGDGCNISQAAIVGLIERSIKHGGVLATCSGNSYEDTDIEGAANVVSTFFQGVSSVWPEAWLGSPRNSRLVHGAGIYAMGCLMDRVMRDVNLTSERSVESVKGRLLIVQRRCAWTSGQWPRLNCAWNEIQNTSQDKRRLAAYLVSEYDKLAR